MFQLSDIIIRPVITEKSSTAADDYNRYGFEVNIRSNKNQVKEAVEAYYDVKVIKVKTNIKPGKLKRVGKGVRKTPKVKRAYVQLAEGQKIEFFKSV